MPNFKAILKILVSGRFTGGEDTGPRRQDIDLQFYSRSFDGSNIWPTLVQEVTDEVRRIPASLRQMDAYNRVWMESGRSVRDPGWTLDLIAGRFQSTE